ncbi:MAG: PQQ-dependent sugar dehydrogenase [Chitinophagaceae bacterium]
MKKYFTLLVLFIFILSVKSFTQTIVGGRMNEVFLKSDVSGDNILNDPWELTYGPDDSLWVTESKGYCVYKISPNGPLNNKRKILDISLKSTWLGNSAGSDSVFNIQFVFSPTNPQGGLAGMAIHPDFSKSVGAKKYVYISYIRSYLSTGAGNTGVFYQNRIARFTYDPISGNLGNPVSLCDTLPGSSDHNSQRMIIAPVNGVNYLFYAEGDMGAGQFGNQYRVNHAQDSTIYEGKILRFNLEPDGDAGSYDKWIPNDNPFNTTTPARQSAVWVTGIRNNQGFAYDSVRNILYGSSHGPYSDDEVNIIERKRNYGHPLVIGFAADTNYNGSSAGAYSTSGVPLIVSEPANAAAIGSSYKDPLFCGYARPKSEINNIWVTNPGNGGWPSEGWSGLGLYNYSAIPGWKNSLIMSGLKWGRLIRTKLDSSGTSIVNSGSADTVCYFDSNNRYRDMAFGPGGKDIYVIMDKSAATSGPSANNPMIVACRGCLQKFTFLGYKNVSGTSTISTAVPIATGKANLCENANTVTINATNKNDTLWVPITDTSGNIVAEIFANGNNLGNVTTSVYTNSNAVREKASSKTLYLDRNITITPQTQPGSAVGVRLYITNAEFTAFKNGVNSVGNPPGVSNISNLAIFKNSEVCGSAMAVTALALPTTNRAAFGSGGYVLQTSVTSFSTFYFASVSALLPVNLISFNGAVNNDIAKLKWITEDEHGTKNFTLERSVNSTDFYPVVTLAASAAAGQQQYTYPDSAFGKLSAAAVYYRLKVIDNDGKSRLSSTVTLYPASKKGTISIHPNPVIDYATVEVNAIVGEQTSWQVTDMAGKTVLQHTVILTKGKNMINVNLSKLPGGIYYLKVAGSNISQAIKLQKL